MLKNCIFLLLLASPVLAAEPPRVLNWEDCVQIALSRNPDLASSQLALKANQYSYYGSFNGILPQLNLSNSYNYNAANNFGATHFWQAEASATMDVFDMSQIANIRSSRAAVTLAEAALRNTSATVRFNLREAFTQLLFAQLNVEVSRNILLMRQRSAQMLVLRYNAGQESKGNMMRSKAQALQAEAALNQAYRDLRAAQRALARQLGWDDFAFMTSTGTFETQAPPDQPPENFGPLLSQRPDVAVQEATVLSAKTALSQSWSSVWPKLSVNYARTIDGRTEFPNSNYNWSFVGLLSYPLFGGGPTATYFAVASARKNLEKAEQDLRTVQDSAIADLENSYAGFMDATEQVRVQTALLAAARQRNDEADVRYASGLLTYDNWEIIASDRISQERLAIQTQLNAAQAEAAWLKSLGKGLGD